MRGLELLKQTFPGIEFQGPLPLSAPSAPATAPANPQIANAIPAFEIPKGCLGFQAPFDLLRLAEQLDACSLRTDLDYGCATSLFDIDFFHSENPEVPLELKRLKDLGKDGPTLQRIL